MNLGQTIQVLRKKRGLKQGELAEASGLAQSYLSLIEKNKKKPNLATIERIGKSLSLPTPILFFLSLDENDIPTDKKDAYALLASPLASLLEEFFFTTDQAE